MASQALYRKWRSQTFDEVIGQQHVTQTLTNALKLDRVAHAYLFTGPRGTGKTTTARLLAKAVNCLEPDQTKRPCNVCAICTAVNEGRLLDLIEIDAASNTGVDDIRDLRDKVGFRPGQARIKFYIIDEVHMLSNSAFNALLKTLEEPPGHVIFVLATTEPEKIPATITSRCQRFDFKRIRLNDIVQRLGYIAGQEGFAVEPEALEYIARQGGGSMRDAISLLDQLTAYGQDTITLDLVRTMLGTVASQAVIELVDALVERDVAAGLDIINRVVSDGFDTRQFGREVLEYLRAVMLVKLGDGVDLLNLPEETVARIKTQATRVHAPALVRATSLFNSALFDLKSGLLTIPQLPLELAFVEAATPVPSSPEIAQAAPAGLPGQEARTATTVPRPPESSRTGPLPPPPPPAPVQVPVEAAGAESGGITLEVVRGCMAQVLRDIEPKNKTMAETLRNHVHLYRVSGREIFFVTSEFNKGRFEKPKPQAAINDAFSQALHKPVAVHFLSDKAMPAFNPASVRADAGTESDLDEDEELQALLKTAEDLGGQVNSQFLP